MGALAGNSVAICRNGRGFRFAVIAALVVLVVAGCGRSPNGGGSYSNPTSSNAPATVDPNVPTAAEQHLAFSNSQFTNLVMLHIPADDFASTQMLAQQTGQVEWWTFVRSNIGCAQSGYAANLTSHPLPTIDGYGLDGNAVESTLEQAGVRAVQSYTLTLDPTPWGSINRSFACLINTGTMAQFVPGQNLHGDLAIPIGQRVCTRWTYANHYQTPVPGQGTVQVFAGTFTYTMKPLVTGVQFPGTGTASVKLSLNPDNGQWTVVDFQLRDPPISFGGFSGVEPASPTQTTCAGP
jgi:hypothetical protein